MRQEAAAACNQLAVFRHYKRGTTIFSRASTSNYMVKISQNEELRQYLFEELPEEERNAFEARFFEDTDLFHELIELENDLIDSFARGMLKGNDLTRFEKSLVTMPERRERVANARAIQTLISEGKPAALPALSPGQRLSAFFNLRMPLLRLAGMAAVIVLVCITGFLTYRNWQVRQEVARIEDDRRRENLEKEKVLQDRIAQVDEANRRLEAEREEKESVAAQAEEYKRQKQDLEKQLEEIRGQNREPGGRSQPQGSFIAAALDLGRGGSPPKVGPLTGRFVQVTVTLPPDGDYGSYRVKIPGMRDITGSIAQGQESIQFKIRARETNFDVLIAERDTRAGKQILGKYRLKKQRR